MQRVTTESISQNAPLIFQCLETIIDKKVAGIALSFFESVADWFCSWFYPAYQALYNERLIAQQSSQSFPPPGATFGNPNTPVSGSIPPESPGVYRFSEGISVHDQTIGQIAGIKRVQYVDLFESYINRQNPAAARQGQTVEYITLNGKRVFLTARTDIPVTFSRAGFTENIVIKESTTRGEGWFDIIEHESLRPNATAPDTHVYEVDTNKVFRLTLQAGPLEIGRAEEVYVIESKVRAIMENSGLEQIISES